MATWHFIIPFFYGKNKFVGIKGGSPVSKKIDYLSKTLNSIKKLPVDSRVTIFVCNQLSREQALLVHQNVHVLSCHPEHLPIESVKFFQRQNEFQKDDIICFNEDDQILHIADTVRQDILGTSQEVIFSPHRWVEMFYFFRKKGRPKYYFNNRRGLLDNYDNNPDGKEFRFNHVYAAQSDKFLAYAASWFMKAPLFRKMDFNIHAEHVMLESPSFVVFESGYPILKLTNGNQNLGDFMVDHLSGYDYNRRLIR